MVGIQRLFKIIDDDCSGVLSQQEFAKCCKDFKIGISEENIPILFAYFDSNRDGTLSIDEFLMAIRGELNDKRLALVKQAFQKIDKNGNGVLDINDIRDNFKADKHPDVINGKKTADQVLVEFLETFEAHHNVRNGTAADGQIEMEEFIEYYKNISVSIDNDEYFSLMMNNSWNLKGDSNPYKKFEKGWANEEATNAKPVEWRQPQQPVQRTGGMSTDNPLNRQQRYYDKQKNTTATRSSMQTSMHQGERIIDQQTASQIYQKEIQKTQPAMAKSSGPAGATITIKGPQVVPRYQSILLERFRTALQGRGSRGFIGLQRQFKIMDDNNSGTLD